MMAALLRRYPEHRQAVRLLLAGGVRNEGDSARVDDLKALADSLHVSVCSLSFISFRTRIIELWHTPQDHVEFVVNAPYPRVLELLSHASVGLNTMVDEHFGINVVEFMVKDNNNNSHCVRLIG